MKPVRIIALSSDLGFGGAEKQLVQLLNSLDANRFQITLVLLKDGDALLPQVDRERLHDLKFLSIKNRLDFSAVRWLAHCIDECQQDIILCANMYPMIYAYLASKISRKGCRLVEVLHTTELYAAKEKIQMLLYRPLMRRFDEVVFVSSLQKDYWTKTRGLRVKLATTIHNGIDVKHYSEFLPESENGIRERHHFSATDYVLGACAVFRPEKRHIDIIDALARTRKRGVDAKLLLIGDGPERLAIEKKIADLDMMHAVKITGFQPDVRPYIAACDCMVMASVAIETFSIAVLEAMAMRKPVISSIVGGVQEQIEHGKTGMLFQKGDIDALRECITQLDNASMRREMGEAALKKVAAEFSLQKMVSLYEHSFERLV